MVAVGLPDDLARYLAELFAVVREGATASISPAVEELTGHAPRTFEQYARDHADAWR